MRKGTKYPLDISIHTPHTGSDVFLLPNPQQSLSISIHTPHTGSDITEKTLK